MSNFTMKGPQDGLNFHHEKNQPLLRPPSTFSEHWPWFWQYLLSKKSHEKKLVQNLGHNHPDNCKSFCLGGFFLMRNKCLLMTPFLTFKNRIGPLALCCIGYDCFSNLFLFLLVVLVALFATLFLRLVISDAPVLTVLLLPLWKINKSDNQRTLTFL